MIEAELQPIRDRVIKFLTNTQLFRGFLVLQRKGDICQKFVTHPFNYLLTYSLTHILVLQCFRCLSQARNDENFANYFLKPKQATRAV